jgi:hypothetical protein
VAGCAAGGVGDGGAHMMASSPRTALWFLCALTLAGCAAHGRVGTLPTLPDPKLAAEIIVIRDHRFLGAAGTITVVLDGVPVYGIDAGEHVILRVPAGEHVVAASHSLAIDRSIMIDAQAGRRYYVRLQPSMGSGMVPTLVAASQGENLLTKTTRVE